MHKQIVEVAAKKPDKAGFEIAIPLFMALIRNATCPNLS